MRTVSISGFGGSYEWGCQRMLQLGIAWLKEHPNFSFNHAYKQYKNITGVAIAVGDDAEALDKAIMDDPKLKEFGVTGAMHQFVVNHLAYIHRHSYEKWLAEMGTARKPEEFFEFDGEMSSVPTTEFSRKMDDQKAE